MEYAVVEIICQDKKIIATFDKEDDAHEYAIHQRNCLKDSGQEDMDSTPEFHVEFYLRPPHNPGLWN